MGLPAAGDDEEVACHEIGVGRGEHLTHGFWMGLGASTLIAVYDYGGYNNVCLVGGEIKQPQKNIPRAIIASIAVGVARALSPWCKIEAPAATASPTATTTRRRMILPRVMVRFHGI
jgi:L-asparagine transporter-like permease